MTTRLYVAPDHARLAAGVSVLLPEAAAAHATRVLRLVAGADLVLFDGSGAQFSARIAAIARGRVTASVLERFDVQRESPLAVTLLQGVARGERMDLVVQKSTELGVRRIVPLLTARSTVKLDAAAVEKRVEHWRGVAASACEQCGRNVLPQIDAPVKYAAAVAAAGEPVRLLLDPDGDTSCARCRCRAPAASRSSSAPKAAWTKPNAPPPCPTASSAAAWAHASCAPKTAPLAALAAIQALAGDLG